MANSCPASSGVRAKIPSSLLAKNISVYRNIESGVWSLPSPPPQEGRLANVTTRAVGCDGRECADRRAALIAYGEVVWSWRPKVLAPQGPGAPRSWRQVLAKLESFAKGDGGKRDGSPRRARISRQTIAQGRPECLRLYLWSSALRAIFLARGPRVQRSPGLPCALFILSGARLTQNPDAKMSRERVAVPGGWFETLIRVHTRQWHARYLSPSPVG
jgi:hypothetical protein